MKIFLKKLKDKIPDSISSWILLIIVVLMIFFKYYSEHKAEAELKYHRGETDLYHPKEEVKHQEVIDLIDRK